MPREQSPSQRFHGGSNAAWQNPTWQNPTWYRYRDLWIHKGLFEKGFVVIKQHTTATKKALPPLKDGVESDNFFMKDRLYQSVTFPNTQGEKQ